LFSVAKKETAMIGIPGRLGLAVSAAAFAIDRQGGIATDNEASK
jgi:hypothetical protein